MEELPVIAAWDLRDSPERCGARLRRKLNGNQGAFVTSARHNVASRIRGDATLAHSELRAPIRSDFPAPNDLLPEQQVLHDAAANGYLTLFGATAGRSIDIERYRDLPDLGIQFRANPGIVLELADGTIQVRALRIAARVPSITDPTVWALAVLLEHQLAASTVELVVADLLALEVAEHTVELDTVAEAGHEWLRDRVADLRTLADGGRPVTGTECADCPFVWNCSAHEAARR